METIIKFLPGMGGSVVPIITLADLSWPTPTVEEFAAYCGAGDGFFNNIVPEKIWGIIISPACYVHDKMWAEAKPTWADFHHSNSVFWANINSLIMEQSKSRTLARLRLYRAVTYFNAVDSLGASIFWHMKEL